MFADVAQPKQLLKIEDGYELVGFAVCVDDDGNPAWLDFVVAEGGQWKYNKYKFCEQGHPLDYGLSQKQVDAKAGPPECKICKRKISNVDELRDIKSCKDVCNYYYCRICVDKKYQE